MAEVALCLVEPELAVRFEWGRVAFRAYANMLLARTEGNQQLVSGLWLLIVRLAAREQAEPSVLIAAGAQQEGVNLQWVGT